MMHTIDVLTLFQQHRGGAIVIPGRGGRHWVGMSETAFDLPLGDPAMGGHAGFGLGLALAQPNRKVVLFDSEGDLLMSLGMLATIAEQAPANFYHLMLDNECYATTGGQPVPNAKTVAYDMPRSPAAPAIRARSGSMISMRCGANCRASYISRGRCSWR